jgi:hypothetical protein
MDYKVTLYLMYLAITVPLTIWVGRALRRHGSTFLVDVFHGDSGLASAVNQLLTIGFYLLNLGYVTRVLRSGEIVDTVEALVEQLAEKVGGVALVIGVVHLVNVWALNSYRRRAVLRAHALPPIEPNRYTPVEQLAGFPPPAASAS